MFNFRKLALAMTVALCGGVAMGAPARPGIIERELPDGSTLSLNLRGDESHHQYFSLDGYPVMESADGYFYYGTLSTQGRIESSDIRVSNIESRDSHEKAFISGLDRELLISSLNHDLKRNARAKHAPQPQRSNYPTIGEQHALVVLVEYTDSKFSVENPQQAFYNMMNEENYNFDGATGSARQYFENASDGKFKPTFDVIGPITLSHDVSYYGGNTAYGDARPEEMAIEACQLIDDTVDFSLYDNNKDGFIDNVYVFYAGLGEASGGNSNTVWPHSWDIYDVLGKRFEFDGLVLNHYACSNEIYNGKIEGIGTFCHEFSHVLGLVDEYSTSYTSSFVPGNYSTLCYGCYNNDSKTPAGYTLYQKYELGWSTPIEIGEPAQLELQPLVTSNTGYILRTSNPNEYFLLENRQLESWDAYIPGHGMLIWHIDYEESAWYYNQPNDNPSHQHIDIEEADNIQTEDTRDGDIFPGTAGITSFTDETRPSSISWDYEFMNKPITDIREIDGVIYFQISGGIPMDKIEGLSVSDVTPVSAVVAWNKLNAADGYYLCLQEVTAEGNIAVEGYEKMDVADANSVVLSDLRPSTDYSVSIIAYNKFQDSEPSDAVVFTTLDPTFDMYIPVALEATEVGETSFIANWETLDKAQTYYLNVYNKDRGEALVATADFTGGIKELPEGFTTTSSATYANESYSGAAVPSLRMTNDRVYIESPKFADDIRSFSFWHRGVGKSEENYIAIYVYNDNQWKEYDRISVSADEGGVTYNVEEGKLFRHYGSDSHAVKLEFIKNSNGSLALDDFCINHGGEVIPRYFGDFDGKDMASALTAEVTGLENDQDYYYTVFASDGQLRSLLSNEVHVHTLIDSSVEAVDNSALRISAADGILSIHGDKVLGMVSIYDMTGRLIARFDTQAAEASVAVAQGGVYIVCVDGKSSKVIVK
ncbi:MAG: M6 family metalloprotease domain-containing protein [Muribaculaceae bacterium]|nr:M6 family metalloprotease domain-containing protein [Muribaculaceae bacterium]